MNPQAPHLKVLVVEDDRTYSRLACQILEGHERFDAATAAEGLARFYEHKPDIVLLDIGLPDQNGLDTLLEMKAARADAFIVMFTASSVSKDVEESLRRGAAGYITKPLTRGKLVKYIAFHEEYRARLAAQTDEERRESEQHFRQLAEQLAARPEPASARLSVEEKPLGARVLYVESDAENSNRVREHLLADGHITDTVHSGEMALKQAKRHAYDCLVISAPVADMETAMLVLKLRVLHKHTPICVLLESEWDRDNPKWGILQISEFLVKPVKIRHLSSLVARHVLHEQERKKERYV